MKLIILVVNKTWELDPILTVFLTESVVEKKAQLDRHPRPRPNQNPLPPEELEPKPRAVLTFTNAKLEVWCIADLLEHVSHGRLQSSTQQKAQQLPKIFNGREFDLVVAVGTGASIGPDSLNGSVVVGTKVFMHNAHPNGTNFESDWREGPFDCVLDSSLGATLFSGVSNVEKYDLIKRFLPVPNGFFPTIVMDYDGVALNTINVTDHKEYEVLDAVTVGAFADAKTPFPARSIETTHGLIRIYGGARFIFMSAITNRLGHFEEEVSGAQKAASAHNAGVVAAWMIPNLANLL